MSRLAVGSTENARKSSVISLEIDPLADSNMNDAVFGETLTMIIPIITREQNIIMDLFGLRPTDLIKNNVREWQEDLGDRTREPIKEQKTKRLIT
jgi:hypothetical protein